MADYTSIVQRRMHASFGYTRATMQRFQSWTDGSYQNGGRAAVPSQALSQQLPLPPISLVEFPKPAQLKRFSFWLWSLKPGLNFLSKER